jgi:hypothetical protein
LWAFYGCANLTTITFQGTITSNGFSSSDWGYVVFYGDLCAKYLAGGIGTYITTAPVDRNSKWTKQ